MAGLVTIADLPPTSNCAVTFELHFGYFYSKHQDAWFEYMRSGVLGEKLEFLDSQGYPDMSLKLFDLTSLYYKLKKRDHDQNVTDADRQVIADYLNGIRFKRRQPRWWRRYSPIKAIRERPEFVPVTRDQAPPHTQMGTPVPGQPSHRVGMVARRVFGMDRMALGTPVNRPIPGQQGPQQLPEGVVMGEAAPLQSHRS